MLVAWDSLKYLTTMMMYSSPKGSLAPSTPGYMTIM